MESQKKFYSAEEVLLELARSDDDKISEESDDSDDMQVDEEPKSYVILLIV